MKKVDVTKIPAYDFVKRDAAIKLDQNESPYDVPGAIKKEIMEKSIGREWNRYPSLYGDDLKEKLSGYLAQPVTNLAVGTGSDELLSAIGALIAGQKKKVLLIEPTFQMYRRISALYNYECETLLLNDDLSYPFTLMLEAVKKKEIGLTFIASPNSPTGSSLSKDQLQELAENARGFLVIDEAYFEFSGVTMIDMVKKYEHLIITRTFSKAFSLAGLRIGYMIAAANIVNRINRLKMPFSMNLFSETAAITMLDNKEFLDSRTKKIMRQKKILWDALTAIKDIRVFPSDANFFLVDIGRPASSFVSAMLGFGIVVRDLSKFQKLETCVRITVGRPEENQMLIKAINEIFSTGVKFEEVTR